MRKKRKYMFDKCRYLLKGELQIILLKFGGVWILYPEVSKFKLYPVKFWGVWILHHDVSKFGFYPLNFRCV